MSRMILVAIGCLCCLAEFAIGQATRPTETLQDVKQREQDAVDPAKGYRWRDYAKKHGWTQADIDAVGRDKVFIGREQFKQVFTPYVKGGYPKFITSDSLLNAYHVLFEETVRRVEVAHATKVRGILQGVWKNLDAVDGDIRGDPALIAAAKRRARITVAVGLSLMGDDSLKLDASMGPVVAAEVKRVREAKAVEMPTWLGKPTPQFLAIDYTRFTPRGFYTESPMLANYFRAVAWLHAIPFRVDDDEQFLAGVMIGSSALDGRGAISEYDEVCDELLGPSDNLDLGVLSTDAMIDPVSKFHLPADLNRLRGEVPDWLKNCGIVVPINDQLRLPPVGGKAAATIRILSAHRTGDAEFFWRLMARSHRPLPSGLDFAAALGSSYAVGHIAEPQVPRVLQPGPDENGSLYEEYLYCMQSLLAPPEKDAPPVFSSPAWRAKSCQTVLAGWAQLRHTWQLQASEGAEFLGEFIGPAGFVEPVPDFYQRMAMLCDRTRQVAEKAGLDGPDFPALSKTTRELIAWGEKEAAATNPDSVEPDEFNLRYQFDFIDAANKLQPKKPGELFFSTRPCDCLAGLKTLAADFDKGVLPDDPEVAKLFSGGNGNYILNQWRELQATCLRLDALANKQLRGVDFNADDNGFINDYGNQIAHVMLYAGNSYLLPHDDAMRIADVYRNPNVGRYLEVAVGRPRALYVLYPYHGGEVLCEGAVMPYYEFPHATPMTDSQWKAMLDSKAPPKPMISQ